MEITCADQRTGSKTFEEFTALHGMASLPLKRWAHANVRQGVAQIIEFPVVSA
jgi:hypothetical protein